MASKTPIFRVGLRFLVFGPAALIASVIVGNSSLLAAAIDNTFDGGYMTFSGWIDERLARSKTHRFYCKLRGRLGMLSAVVTVPFVIVSVVLERNRNEAGLTQMVVGLVIGAVGVALTLKGHREIESHGDHHHKGFDTHLLQDMGAAVIAAISGILAYSLDRAVCNFIGGLVILAFVIVLGAIKANEMRTAIDHPEELHDHTSESPAEHARHSVA